MEEGKKVVDTPVDADLEHAISSNWACDHAADPDAHHEAQPTNYKAMAHPNANQSITANTWTALTLDIEDYDPNSNFSSNRYTVAKAGYYLMIGQMQISSLASTQTPGVAIYKNGSLIAATMEREGGGMSPVMQASAILSLAVSDYIELYVYHNDTTSRSTNAVNCWLAIHLISA